MFAAIDIDGTTTRYPYAMRRIVEMCQPSVFLTGHSSVDPSTADMEDLIDGRRKQLAALGITQPCTIIVCVGRDSSEVAEQKGAFCRDNNVTLFIDDSLNYCEAVRRLSPKTAILHVYK